jgi:hypothetical protein
MSWLSHPKKSLYLNFFTDLELPEQPKRRRIRRHKSKKNITNLSDVIVRQTELETQQKKMHPQHPDPPALSKNKRRKLKTKLRLRRKREAGLATKASGVSFTYQPESSEEAEAEDDVGGEEEGDPERSVTDITQEDIELASSRAEGVLSFLKSTQELYFYDGRHPYPGCPLHNGIHLGFGK